MTTRKDFIEQISDYLGWKIESGHGISGDDIADIAENAGFTFDPEPVTGLLGRWAEHPEHGRVLIASDHPDTHGKVYCVWLDPDEERGTVGWGYELSDLTLIDQETVTTEDEYAELPAGSVVAEPFACPLFKDGDMWSQDGIEYFRNSQMAGTTRHLLRRGWGE